MFPLIFYTIGEALHTIAEIDFFAFADVLITAEAASQI